MKKFFLIVCILITNSLVHAQGRMINPVTDVNYLCASPVITFGITILPTSLNPLADVYDASRTRTIPPLCVCPGVPPIPGISFGMNVPTHILESANQAFRFPSLGMKISGSPFLAGSDEGGKAARNAYSFTHIIGFNVLKILDIFADTMCKDSSSTVLDLLYLSEIDPVASSSAMALLLFPEAVLMSNPIVAASCAADAIAALGGINLDLMYWCVGGHSIYPLSNYSPQANSMEDSAALNMAKMMYRMNRETAGQTFKVTAGLPAMCFNPPSPLVIKSQYRLQAAMPLVGTCERLGTPSVKWNTPKRSTFQGDKVDILWTRKDCCAL